MNLSEPQRSRYPDNIKHIPDSDRTIISRTHYFAPIWCKVKVLHPVFMPLNFAYRRLRQEEDDEEEVLIPE